MPIKPASFNITFTNAAQLKAMSVVQENVDDKLIQPLVLDVQQRLLQSKIGSPLYVHLQDAILSQIQFIQTSGATGQLMSEDDSFLINAYITPLLKFAILMELTNSGGYQFTNKGLLQAFADQEKPPSSNDLSYMYYDSKKNYDWYAQWVINYLGANFNKYPDYLKVIQYDDIPPAANGFSVPFAMGGSNRVDGEPQSDDFYRWFYLQRR